jgi:hypothetical protein
LDRIFIRTNRTATERPSANLLDHGRIELIRRVLSLLTFEKSFQKLILSLREYEAAFFTISGSFTTPVTPCLALAGVLGRRLRLADGEMLSSSLRISLAPFVVNSTGAVVYVYNSGNVAGYDIAAMTPIGMWRTLLGRSSRAPGITLQEIARNSLQFN